MNYFALLNLPHAFDIDLQALETAYFTQQRLYHPDRFVAKPPEQRQQALQKSIDVNHAYNTLKNPLLRAQYLLHLQGIEVGTDKDNVKPSQALLMETLAWREMVDEAAGADEYKKLDGQLVDMVQQSIATLSRDYQAGAWADMAQATLRLGYIIKAREAAMQQRKRVEKQAV